MKEHQPAQAQQVQADGRTGATRLLPALLQALHGNEGVEVALATAPEYLCSCQGRGNWGGQREGAGKPPGHATSQGAAKSQLTVL